MAMMALVASSRSGASRAIDRLIASTSTMPEIAASA